MSCSFLWHPIFEQAKVRNHIALNCGTNIAIPRLLLTCVLFSQEHGIESISYPKGSPQYVNSVCN